MRGQNGSGCSNGQYGSMRQYGLEHLDSQATVECGFTLKRVRDMTRTYSLI